jgi:hypothetical protein
VQHRIHISGEREFDVTGAVTLTSHEPVIAAARALREAGADEHDIIFVTGPCVAILPATIFAILKPRRRPLQSEIRAMLGMAR